MANLELSVAEQVALWADKIRDISATGLYYQPEIYDRERYEVLQAIAIEMLAWATQQPIEEIDPLKATIFARMSPQVAGAAAVIDQEDQILLMRRADNGLWNLPGGQLEVGETPAEGVVRETFEETGVRCKPVALSGIYDSRLWDHHRAQHLYKFTFLCEPLSKESDQRWHQHETLEIGWFSRNRLPVDLYEGHRQRIEDAYRVKVEKKLPYFDF